MITSKNYISRRRKLADIAKQPLIVITGADLVQKSSDETYEFAQDGYFYYLTGIEEPGWVLVMDVLKGSEFLISTNESSYHSDVWEPLKRDQDIAKLSGIPDIRTRRDGWAFLNNEVSNYQSIGSIVPRMRFSRPFGMYINPSKTMLVERLKRIHTDANLIDISAKIRELRSVKDDDEVAEIKKAIDITASGFEVINNNIASYKNEAEVFADLAYTFMKAGSDFGYRPVIAYGANATYLHYKNNNAPITRGEYLLVDAGASSNRYSADITRAIEVGTVPQRKKDFLTELYAASEQSLAFLGPGVSMRDHEMHIEQAIGHSLNKLGIINTMLRKDIRTYYPHAISHHLGVDVHDSCDYEAPLQPGAVITVEPGIYVPDEGIGVRYENDVLITETGVEVLSKGIA